MTYGIEEVIFLFFVSQTLLGADNDTIALTPTHVNNITYIRLANGLYDCLYITKETDSDPSMDCPSEWDFDTIFHADFNNSTNAGNVDWNLRTVTHLLIKRRNTEKFRWNTIAVREVRTLEDFTEGLRGNDYTNACHVEYEYAVVPVFHGLEEGTYYTTFVDSEFNDIFIVEKNCIFGTPATDGYCDTTRRIPSSINETIHNRYPTYIRNTVSNYDKGSCKGMFIELDDENCDLVVDDALRIPYQRKIMDFLADGMPKILKHFDGRIWLMIITGDPTDTADTTYQNRNISFEWAEIGDYNSERDLYYTNLSDIEEKWWNK